MSPEVREAARVVLEAALPHLTENLETFIDDWYDRWAGPGESWTASDLAAAVIEHMESALRQ